MVGRQFQTAEAATELEEAYRHSSAAAVPETKCGFEILKKIAKNFKICSTFLHIGTQDHV